MTDNFPEAGAIGFTTIQTPEDYVWNVTLRDVDGASLAERMIGFQKFCKKNDWIPVKPKQFGMKKEVKYVEGATCPKCGSRLVEKPNKNGGVFWKCEKGGYDFTTKQNTGCDYVDWTAGKHEDIEVPEGF